MTSHMTPMTYDDALREFLATKGTFGGGLSNHGPMVTEALDHMDVASFIGPFFDAYRPRLEARATPTSTGQGWRELIVNSLPDVVDAAAADAGHCLLRVAHATRGIERAEADGHVPGVRVDELHTALRRWRRPSGLPTPGALTGDFPIDEWSTSLARLATFEPAPGLLTAPLRQAAEQPGFVDVVGSLQRCADPRDTLDLLAMRALDGYLANADPMAQFTLLHGVTVSSMARILVDHLDEPGRARLEAAVAGFVAAAAVAFDRRTEAPTPPPIADARNLAERAGATLDDHTVKFTDACLGLAERTASDLPLRAAESQIRSTSSPVRT